VHPGIGFGITGNTVKSVAAAGMVEDPGAEAFLEFLS
jgi:hypothetical protein